MEQQGGSSYAAKAELVNNSDQDYDIQNFNLYSIRLSFSECPGICAPQYIQENIVYVGKTLGCVSAFTLVWESP